MNTLKFKKNNKKGFTLMEMLIVVAIIGILIAIAIPTFTSALNKAHDAADAANLRSYYAEIQVKELLGESYTAPKATDNTTVTINGTTYTLYSKYDYAKDAKGNVTFTLHGKTGDVTVPGTALESAKESTTK